MPIPWFGTGATPPYVGSGTTPPYSPSPYEIGSTRNRTTSNSWTKYLPDIVGTGASLAATALQARSQGQQNQAAQERIKRLDELTNQENARKDYFASILMPSILRGLGQRNPQVIAMARQRMLAQNGGAPAPQQAAPQQQQAPAQGGGPDTGGGWVDPLQSPFTEYGTRHEGEDASGEGPYLRPWLNRGLY